MQYSSTSMNKYLTKIPHTHRAPGHSILAMCFGYGRILIKSVNRVTKSTICCASSLMAPCPLPGGRRRPIHSSMLPCLHRTVRKQIRSQPSDLKMVLMMNRGSWRLWQWYTHHCLFQQSSSHHSCLSISFAFHLPYTLSMISSTKFVGQGIQLSRKKISCSTRGAASI